MTGEPGLILASASPARRRLLEAAGLEFAVEPARVDETAVKEALRAEGASAAQAAETLAELKAVAVSRRHPGALVIGADQVLEQDGTWFDKPETREGARDQLLALRGRRHHLATAVVIARAGARIWHHVERPSLTVRPFGAAFLERYLDAAGPGILASVGAYHLEGLGVQLFDRIEGDGFAIQGLPLLPLLTMLRANGVVAE